MTAHAKRGSRLVAATPFWVVVLLVLLSIGPACQSSRGPAPAARGASSEPLPLVEGPCPWLGSGPVGAAGGNAPWRTMDRRSAAAMLEDVLGRPKGGFSRVTGCWIGFLGSTTIVDFHGKAAPGRAWRPLAPSEVTGLLESLARELPGLALDPRPSAYELLGATDEQDEDGNFTKHLLLKRRDTGGYLLIREYAG